jgi:fructoselysine-6-P-deglycase FrlB-like protein
MSTPSVVEETLRSQRENWGAIADRVAGLSSRDFPHEPPKRILLFGVGSSFFAARLSAYALWRDKGRVRVPVLAVPSSAIGTEILPTKGDWAFAFTHRGGTAITNAALDLCERSGAFSVAVTGKGAPAPGSAKFHLHTVALEKVDAHTSAVTGAICAVTSLILGPKAIEEWDALRSIGDPDLDLYRRRAGDGPTLIVGEWEGEWLAREGALKVMELAKIPVRAYSSEELFHGPHYALSPDDRIWHVSLPKDPRETEIKAHHRVSVYGASPLAWIPALVELQWLSLAVALNRGENPDSVIRAGA